MSLIALDFSSTDQTRVTFPISEWEDDFAYHQRRAEQELQVAQEAAEPAARRFHYHLAALHLDRAHAGIRSLAA